MANIALACTILPDSPPARLIEWSRAAEDAGFSGVFMTEANNDSLACSLALGLNTKRIKLGTAITNIYLRHPNLLANEAPRSRSSPAADLFSDSARAIARATRCSESRWASRLKKCAKR